MIGPVSLRPLRTADATEMVEVLADPSLYQLIGGAPPSLSELEHRYARQARGQSDDGREVWLNYVVVSGADGRAVGYVQATIPAAGGPTEIAWVIGAPWQRRGYARQAALMLCDELRDRGVVEVEAHIHPDNVASQHVARRLGMHPTGRVQQDEVRWAGRLR